ncbi:hypothetical protein GCM10009127_22450 [Alteraurantiacibacter aestuarii]|uniref:protocatechuate 4,5-dioxygenase subunit alpha n=1 Tax=Alteraurantiacibacter aestuarii TaxID=650004 RepID=UPI0031E0DA61
MPPFSRLVAEGKRTIPGTIVFDGDAAQGGYPLNAMCYSFNNAENRKAFAADEEAYMDRFSLSEAQRNAVRQRNVLGMLEAGGNVYYLAKLAGILGLNVQQLGALQTGMELEDFKAGLMAHAMTESHVADTGMSS